MKYTSPCRMVVSMVPLAFTLAVIVGGTSCGRKNPGAGESNKYPSTSQPNLAERCKTHHLHSAAVAKNRLGETGDVNIHVILPPSYMTSSERYPVVYVFQGFNSRPESLINDIRIPLDAAIAAKESPEYLLVAVDGCNQLGGSFYVNSPATGNWEDMVTEEVVNLIERHYRVFPETRARGLAGFGMGGFAAWNLALAHADEFACAWAANPGAFDEQDLREAMPTWDDLLKVAYGAAFAPDMRKKPPFSGIPSFTGSRADNMIVAKWKAGFGDIQGKLTRYQAGSARLSGIRFEYGEMEPHTWIPKGTIHLAEAMKSASVPVEIASWKTGHTVSGEMIRRGFIPFFARMLGESPS